MPLLVKRTAPQLGSALEAEWHGLSTRTVPPQIANASNPSTFPEMGWQPPMPSAVVLFQMAIPHLQIAGRNAFSLVLKI